MLTIVAWRIDVQDGGGGRKEKMSLGTIVICERVCHEVQRQSRLPLRLAQNVKSGIL